MFIFKNFIRSIISFGKLYLLSYQIYFYLINLNKCFHHLNRDPPITIWISTIQWTKYSYSFFLLSLRFFPLKYEFIQVALQANFLTIPARIESTMGCIIEWKTVLNRNGSLIFILCPILVTLDFTFLLYYQFCIISNKIS